VRERPITFSDLMVWAVERGLKTQTRRLVRWPAWADSERDWPALVSKLGLALFKDGRPHRRFTCPYGVVGDRLWVREAHLLDPPIDGTWPSVGDTYDRIEDIPKRYRKPEHVIYRASCARALGWTPEQIHRWRWRPPMFTPRWAARILLELTEVRVQRVQEISERDALAEGFYRGCATGRVALDPGGFYLGPVWPTARAAFRDIWDDINGERSPWERNDHVWALTFKVVEIALNRSRSGHSAEAVPAEQEEARTRMDSGVAEPSAPSEAPPAALHSGDTVISGAGGAK
jgi:hypothetical protein